MLGPPGRMVIKSTILHRPLCGNGLSLRPTLPDFGPADSKSRCGCPGPPAGRTPGSQRLSHESDNPSPPSPPAVAGHGDGYGSCRAELRMWWAYAALILSFYFSPSNYFYLCCIQHHCIVWRRRMAAASVAAMRRSALKRARESSELFQSALPPEDEWACRHDVDMLMLDG